MSILKANRIENLTTTDGGINVNNAGNVKIGTGSDRYDELTASTANLQVDGGIVFEPGSGNNAEIINYRGTPMVFGTSGSERLRIDGSGRLLVGTTSSVSSGGGDLLEVASGVGNILITSTNSTRVADQACGQLRFWGKAGANEELAKIAAVADGTHGAGDKPTRLTFSVTADGASSPTERMRITQSGTIGMGTDEPMYDARLTLAGVNDVALGFKRSDSGRFDNAIHCDGGSMIFKGGANSNIVSGLNEHMRINSGGRLLIGTTTEGNASADNLTVADSADCGITIRSGTSSRGALYFSDATSGSAEFDGYIIYEQNNKVMRFATDATERMRILSSGGLTFNGDTAAANALDDYEEGAWTPTLIGDSGIASHNTQNGTYTKIGRVVHCRCRIDLSSKNTLSGNLSIGGLPFTVANVDSGTSLDFGGVFSYFINASSTVYFISVNPNGGATTASLYFKSSSNSGMNALNKLDIDSDFDFRATFTYYV